MEATITIHSNLICRCVLFISDTHSVSNYKVHSILHPVHRPLITCISGEIDELTAVNPTDRTLWTAARTNMAAPVSHYRSRSRSFRKVFKRPNTLIYTYLWIGISDCSWHGMQVCEYLKLKKEKRNKSDPSVIQCYCRRGVSRDKPDASPWKQ